MISCITISKSRPSLNCSSCHIATSSSAASSPIGSKSPGTVGASGRPGCRLNLAASSIDGASASQEKLKDAYLGGLKDELQKKIWRKRKNKSQRNLMMSPGITSLLLKLKKIVGSTRFEYRHWKQDDYKKKTTMSHKNVSDYETNLWRTPSSPTNQSIQANNNKKIRISNSKEVKNTITHTSSSSSSLWQNSSWKNWSSSWWHSSEPDEGQ